MFYDLKDKKPQNSGENWVAPNATIIGDVTLEKNSSIWFNALNQMLEFFSKVTSPIIVALGATQFSPEFCGFLSFKS